MVEHLIKHGATPSLTLMNKEHRTPLTLAVVCVCVCARARARSSCTPPLPLLRSRHPTALLLLSITYTSTLVSRTDHDSCSTGSYASYFQHHCRGGVPRNRLAVWRLGNDSCLSLPGGVEGRGSGGVEGRGPRVEGDEGCGLQVSGASARSHYADSARSCCVIISHWRSA